MIETKLILSTFLKKYRVVCSEKLENLDIIAESILRSENGLKITIYKRNLE